MWLPAWLFLPRGGENGQPVVLALDSGRTRGWPEGDLFQSLAGRGYPVCSADVRGLGDLTPEFGRGSAGYAGPHEHEEDYAWCTLIFGRPLLGQRVADILALAAGLRKHPALGSRRIVVAARGRMTVPAIFAAALFIWSIRTFRSAGTPVPGNQPTAAIVKVGPYRLSRNPIYLAFSLFQTGIALGVNDAWILISLLPAIAIISSVVIPREERYLEARFGGEYTKYKASVRRWL